MVMQKNNKLLEKHIVQWIRDQASKRGIDSLIVRLSNTLSSICNLHLCQKTQMHVEVFICENDSFATEFLYGFCNKDNIHTNSYLSSDVIDQISEITRAAICGEKEKLVVSSINKIEFLYTRPYIKNEYIDILPLADLFYSEIHAMYLELINDINLYNHSFDKQNKSLLNDLDWIADIDYRTGLPNLLDNLPRRDGIIKSLDDPTKHSDWFKFTIKQKELIAKIHQIEKLTKHKMNINIPICRIPYNL
jgi:hypothetical protein